MQGKRTFSQENVRVVWLAVGIIGFLVLGIVLASYLTPAPPKNAHVGHPVVLPPVLTNEDDGISFTPGQKP